MPILIDTHVLIWFLEGNNLLPTSHRRIIANQNSNAFISTTSIWEIAIKISIGKLVLAKPLADVIKQIANGFSKKKGLSFKKPFFPTIC